MSHGWFAVSQTKYLISLFLLSASAFAESLSVLTSHPTATAPSVCQRRKTATAFESAMRDPLLRFAFDNDGGLGNGGVCWWHSRFQRAVWSLAEFRPDLLKPSVNEARKIIKGFARFRGVQIVPGYADFFTFSADFRAEIQKELNAWQLRDGAIQQSWIRGLYGTSDLSRRPKRLRKIMDRLFQYAERGKREQFTPWVMLQMKGLVGAHAALIVDMRMTKSGYELDIVDSNFPDETPTWTYQYGDGQLGDSRYDIVPYKGLHRDIPKINRAIEAYCMSKVDTSPQYSWE